MKLQAVSHNTTRPLIPASTLLSKSLNSNKNDIITNERGQNSNNYILLLMRKEGEARGELKQTANFISEIGEAMPTKSGVNALGINPYLYKFFDIH